MSSIRLRASSDCSIVMSVDFCTISCKPSSIDSPIVRYSNAKPPRCRVAVSALSESNLSITNLLTRLLISAPDIDPILNLPILGKPTILSINAYGTPAILAMS